MDAQSSHFLTVIVSSQYLIGRKLIIRMQSQFESESAENVNCYVAESQVFILTMKIPNSPHQTLV